MTVGGWYDAEDLYGPLSIYKTIEKNNPKAQNTIVMGPWAHGDWAREKGKHVHNHIYYGDSISTFYQKNIERKFFAHHLKGSDIKPMPEAYMYDTGIKQWQTFPDFQRRMWRRFKPKNLNRNVPPALGLLSAT